MIESGCRKSSDNTKGINVGDNNVAAAVFILVVIGVTPVSEMKQNGPPLGQTFAPQSISCVRALVQPLTHFLKDFLMDSVN